MLKNLRESLTDMDKSLGYGLIWTKTKDSLVLQSFIDLEINICSLTNLQDYMEVMIRFLYHLF